MEYYGFTDSNPSELELCNRELARRTAAEGFVLLKNEGGALPLKTRKIALYGVGARKTVKGGLGSGSVEERYSVTIEDGLKNAGYEIATKRWLDNYDAEYEAAYQEYRAMVEEKIAGLTNPMEIIPLAHSYVYRYPSGRPITQADVDESGTDTAIFVLTRQAGECNDRKLEPGDYYITDVERENLRQLARCYRHTILVVNVGGLVDFGFLDEIHGIDAVVLFVQGGEEGGNALADVLSGKANFSGKLADTVPLCYEDIPFGNEFSYLNGDLNNEYYREDIYVGYRYFDAFGKAVRFPFGFGLSYTQFKIQTEHVSIGDCQVKLTVSVQNVGPVSGKEVVQIYLSVPGSGEYQRLAAFAKTGEIAPGESERVSITFPFTAGSVYSETRSAWLLPAGSYLIRVGSSSRDTETITAIHLEWEVIVRQCKACCAPTDTLDELTADIQITVPDGVPVLSIDPDTIPRETVDYAAPQVEETPQEKKLLDSLSLEEMAEFLRGGALQNVPAGAHDIHGAAGKTATSLLHKGIGNVVFADGPAGVNVVNKVCLCDDGTVKPVEVPERYNWGFLAKMAKMRLCSSDGTIIYRYATAWPVEMLLAQTWNAPLVREIGDAVGREMTAFGVTLWLSPGMNIHRNPLSGRTFEYYSEDPVLTGELAAALTQGVQAHPGVGTCVKHFCCNNTEDNRMKISSNVSERALREIYLKGFEIAVRKSQPAAVMSSYNQLNHIYTANRHDLLTDILRCEWGFDGLVMTDWGSCDVDQARPELCALAGNDLIMPGSRYDQEQILLALEDGRLDAAVVRRSACRVLRLMLEANVPVILENEE